MNIIIYDNNYYQYVGKDLSSIMQQWNRRLMNVAADYIILRYGAYSPESVYPYILHSKLTDIWPNFPLQTIYSAINRLEENGLLRSRMEIVDGRTQKIVETTEMGFDAIEEMKESFDELSTILEEIEV